MPHTILFCSDLDDPLAWHTAVQALRPDVSVVDWRQIDDPAAIGFALLWKPPPQGLSAFAGLKAIQALGAGVDQLDLGSLPEVPLARLIDASLTGTMVDYAIAAVFRYFRGLDRYERSSRARQWIFAQAPRKAEFAIGVMGLGVLGSAVAQALAELGFPVRGWSRGGREIDGVHTFAGVDTLDEFLAGTRILINLLALTAQTTGILNRRTLDALPPGSFLVNIGRGAHLVEEDLVAALDSGHLAGATLDAFRQEPLPDDHPLNGRDDVLITPHVAAGTDPRIAAPFVLENMDRALAGRPLLNRVDRNRGY